MTDKIDFFIFYEQLGLNPDCSLEELKIAYRRRIAELHPDRHAMDHDNPAAAASLQELTVAYTAATVFQRRYGRLPGACHVNARIAPATSGRPSLTTAQPGSTGLHLIAIGLLVLAVLAWILWSGSTDERSSDLHDPQSNAAFAAASPQPRDPVQTGSQRLELGMEVTAVRAIEGSPVMESAERWDYGPSWIEFDHGKVSDWYSSKLRPLRTPRARP